MGGRLRGGGKLWGETYYGARADSGAGADSGVGADSGAGADSVKNDGMYARYFTHYTGQGRYSVKCQVEGDQDTQVNQGFLNGRKDRSIPMKPGTPVCCGSDALRPGTNLTNTGVFSR